MSKQKTVNDNSENDECCENALNFIEQLCSYHSVKLYPWQKDLLKEYLKRRKQNG